MGSGTGAFASTDAPTHDLTTPCVHAEYTRIRIYKTSQYTVLSS
jgi:hypothetical protein